MNVRQDTQSNSTNQRSLWSVAIIGSCLLGLFLFLLATVIVLSLIPIYLNSRNVQTVSTINTPTFDATYLVRSGDVSSATNINSIDRTRTARSFSQGLRLSDPNSLAINRLSQDSVVTAGRQKRLVKCDRGSTDVNGTGLIFQFSPLYSSSLICQSDTCKVQKFEQIYQSFRTVTDLSIELAGKIISLELCSLGILSYTPSNSAGAAPSALTTTTTTTVSPSNVWQLVSSMSSARYQPTNALNTAGDIVIISGSSSIYDFPTTSLCTIDTFAENGSLISSQNMTRKRNFHSTNHLPSSNLILFAGGIDVSDGTKLNTAELFNLNTGAATLVTMSSIRLDHQSTVVNSSNRVVLIGGTNENGSASNSGDVFDGTSFTSIGNQMTFGRRYHTVTYLPTINKILIVGGETTVNCASKILNTVELYDVASNMFGSSTSITMSTARSLHTATYIPAPYNQVLIIGGSSNGTNTLNTYEIFDVSSLSFTLNGTIQSARAAHTATLVDNDTAILIVGGYASNEAINVTTQPMAPCEMFNISTMASTMVANMNVPRALHTAALLSNSDDVLCCGGIDSNNNALASCELLTVCKLESWPSEYIDLKGLLFRIHKQSVYNRCKSFTQRSHLLGPLQRNDSNGRLFFSHQNASLQDVYLLLRYSPRKANEGGLYLQLATSYLFSKNLQRLSHQQQLRTKAFVFLNEKHNSSMYDRLETWFTSIYAPYAKTTEIIRTKAGNQISWEYMVTDENLSSR